MNGEEKRFPKIKHFNAKSRRNFNAHNDVARGSPASTQRADADVQYQKSTSKTTPLLPANLKSLD
jgi:hypothetical protein